MRVFILTGEPSGDLHGARLAEALYALEPAMTIMGAGGVRMREAGVRIVADSEHWGAIGIPEALRKIPLFLTQLLRLTHLLRDDPPDVLVPIDFGAFNVALLKRLGAHRPRTVYFIPPGCWSRHRAPGQLPYLVEGIATPFPWSAENLRAANAPARIEWVGHPILEYTQDTTSREDARRRLNIDASRPVIALAPGSRRSELRYLLPVFIETLKHISPAPQVLLTVAPNLEAQAIRSRLPAELSVHCLRGIDYHLIQAADAALVASGTATLELACLNIPMVVAYRGSFTTWLQYCIVARGGRLRYISLPNILADQSVVPELLQHAAHPEALAAQLIPLLTDTPARRAQLEGFAHIRTMLGEGQAIARTAELVMKVGKQT